MENKVGVRLSIKGLNMDRLIAKELSKYTLYDFDRDKYDSVTFTLSHKNYKNLLSNIDTSCYTITVLKSFKTKAFDYFIRSIGMLVAVLMVSGMFYFLSPYVFFISINCSDDSIKSLVYSSLSEKYMYQRFDTDMLGQVQTEVENTVQDISLLSISKKGNTLLVNIKPTEKLNTEYEPLYAPYNLMITDISVFQGTSAYKSGDIVKAGDVLVEPYVFVNGEKQYVEPNANIKARVWVVGLSTFQEKTENIVRTGNVIANIQYEFLRVKFDGKKTENNFESFETETYEQYVSSMFLPIKINKQIYYETTIEEVLHDFEQEKEQYIAKSRLDAYAKLKTSENVKETLDILDRNGIKYIKTTLEFDIEVKK